jgi:hypothetical protein
MRLLLALLGGVAACAPVQGVPRAPAGLLAPPDLVPVAGLLAAGDALATLASPAPGLSAEAEALASRAGDLAAPTAGAAPGAAPDPGRAAALAARAATLRAPVLSDDERARLGQDATQDASGAPSLQ